MGDKMIYLTGLWLNETSDGKKYFTGYLGQGRVMIFRNEKKRPGSNDPDYNMLIAPKPDEDKNNPDAGDDIPF